MQDSGGPTYPGDTADAVQFLKLATEFRMAAKSLEQLGRPGQPMSRAPYRFAAIHAIELYLNALLRHAGLSVSQIRNMHHNLEARTTLAEDCGLRLRKRTLKHLSTITDSREYLVSRYDPEMIGTVSELNRLNASLDEVAQKVTDLVVASELNPERTKSISG